MDIDSSERLNTLKLESNLSNQQTKNNDTSLHFNLKSLKAFNVNNNNVFRKPIGKNIQNGHTKNVISNPISSMNQLKCNNYLNNNHSNKNTNLNSIQETTSPGKITSQISSINNNLTTNFTDNAKEFLTIKTNSLENESVNPSPSNFKFLMNNLKTISQKITPTNQIKFSYNFNEENIKIFQNDTDLNGLLNSIKKFGSMIKPNTNFNLNELKQENLKKLNELNELLKSMNFFYKKEETPKIDLKKPLNSTKNSKKENFINDLHKGMLNQEKTLITNKNICSIKPKKNNVHKLFSPPAAKTSKINFDLKLSIKNINDHSNNSQIFSHNPSESKVNSAKTRERIINEIYTSSDLRIKKYKTFLEFLGINLKDIREIMLSQNNFDLSCYNGINKTKKSNNLHQSNKIELDKNSHGKKISPTSNEIEKIAKEINEGKSLIFSSISILNSTLKKTRPEDLTSNKIIDLSKNHSNFLILNKEEICDFNESDIKEFYADECLKSPRYEIDNQLNAKNRVSKRNVERANNLLSNLSRSFIISSINSDFYKYFIEDSSNNCQVNTLSNEMSVLKGFGSDLLEGIEQSIIIKKNNTIKNEDLERTIENIQRM